MDNDKKPGFGHRIRSFLNRELPSHIVIAHKALLLYVLITYRWLFLDSSVRFPFLPFITVFDAIPSVVYKGLLFILFVAIISSFLKFVSYRICSLISGSIILFLILSSKNLFSNSLTFVACLLVLIGLYKEKDILFRIQIALLYVGASTNKMIDPDWWNGIYFDFFFRDIFDVALYQSWVPEKSLAIAKSFGIATIFTELSLGIAVLIPRITRPTIIFGLLFHTSMLVITSGRLSNIFFYIMCAGFLLISNIHIQQLKLSYKFSALLKLVRYLDPSDSIILSNQTKDKFILQTINGNYYGIKGVIRLFFSKQVLISAFFLLFMIHMQSGFFISKILHPIFSIF